MEIVLHCSTCHSKFVRGSPLVPLQRPTLTGTDLFNVFGTPVSGAGHNLVCDGKRSLRQWGFFSNALPFSRLWYGTSHGKTSAPPPARQTGTSGCEVSVKTLATHRAACRTRRGHSPVFSTFSDWTCSVLDRIVLFYCEGRLERCPRRHENPVPPGNCHGNCHACLVPRFGQECDGTVFRQLGLR